MFELTQDEWESLRCKNSTSKRGGTRYMPYAFTERAFVVVRQMLLNSSINPVHELQSEVKELKEYIEEVFADYNDINADTRMQLELINQTLAELQAQKALADKPRNPIGFVIPNKNKE